MIDRTLELLNTTACLVGSRNITQEDISRISVVSEYLNKLNMDGRSGGAKGADSEWAKHVLNVLQILPYQGFNNLRQTGHFGTILALDYVPNALKGEAEQIARLHHPYGDSLRGFALQAHTRNVFQALGLDLKSPASLTIYVAKETPSRKVSGGTATAVEISRSHGIPCFNLRIDSDYAALTALLEEAVDF